MKNFVKFAGIIAMVTVIGFSFAACDNGGGGGGDTYEASAFMITPADYAQVIGTLGPAYAQFLDVEKLVDATLDQGEEMYIALIDKATDDPDENTGLSLSDLKDYFREGGLPDDDVNGLSQKLAAQGFLFAGKPYDSNTYGIIGCRKL